MTFIIAVDDSLPIRKILKKFLEPAGFSVETAEDGERGWELLVKNPGKYSTVLLDREMPKMNGMEVLARIKEHEELQTIPVIMQTSLDAKKEIMEGLEAGAYYYLTKPYTEESLLSIVKTAVADHTKYRSLREETRKTVSSVPTEKSNRYAFRTLDEADMLATLMSRMCPEPEKVVTGLFELLINAIEHGNLGIDYEEKSALIDAGQWEIEVNRRLLQREYLSKAAHLEYEFINDEIHFRIRDEGNGFDWEKYLEISPERAFDTHGRGIAMARKFSFDSLQYLNNGKELLAVVINP